MSHKQERKKNKKNISNFSNLSQITSISIKKKKAELMLDSEDEREIIESCSDQEHRRSKLK